MAGQFTPTNLDILRRTTRMDFFSTLGTQAAVSLWSQVCMDLDSDSDQEVCAFFGSIPKPKRVDRRAGGGQVSERVALNDYSLTIVNATWKLNVPVHRDTIADAKLNQISVRAKQQAESAMLFLDERLTTVIEANANSYDGIAYFGSLHDGGTGNNHSNDVTSDIATPAAPTIAEFETSFNVALTRLRLLEDDQNRKINSGDIQLVCMVPANMEYAARAVLEIGPVAGQTGNSGVFKGKAKVAVNPFVSSSLNERFYLYATGSAVKPLVYQKREEWDFKLVLEGDDWEKDDMGAMISRGRFEFSGADHKRAVRCVMT